MEHLDSILMGVVAVVTIIGSVMTGYAAGSGRVYHGRVVSAYRPSVYVQGWKKKLASMDDAQAGRN